MAATNKAKQAQATHDAHGHAADTHHEGHGHIGRPTYYRVFAGLMVLMFLTVAAYWVEGWLLQNPDGFQISRLAGVIIAMAIAIAKTTLIVLYFMHVKVSERISQLYAAAAFVGLLILFIIIMGDYVARGWPPAMGPLT